MIAAEGARISHVARHGDLAAPVSHLGRWKVRDVVAHLGGVHRWAARIVAASSMDGPGFQKSKLDGTELLDWFDDGVTALVDVLRATGPDEPCPNFNPGSPELVRFWLRRQLHETTIHRWDVEAAAGAPAPIPVDVATDGIDEYLDVFVRTRGKQTLSAPLRLVATEERRSWTLTPAAKPGRLVVDPADETDVRATIEAPAEQLLLYLWGRLPFEEAGLSVSGDAGVARSLRAVG